MRFIRWGDNGRTWAYGNPVSLAIDPRFASAFDHGNDFHIGVGVCAGGIAGRRSLNADANRRRTFVVTHQGLVRSTRFKLFYSDVFDIDYRHGWAQIQDGRYAQCIENPTRMSLAGSGTLTIPIHLPIVPHIIFKHPRHVFAAARRVAVFGRFLAECGLRYLRIHVCRRAHHVTGHAHRFKRLRDLRKLGHPPP